MNAKELALIRTFHTHPQTDCNGNVISKNDFNVWFTGSEFKTFCDQICLEQRQLVADELKRYSEDLSIPNQYKINDLCMDAPMPEL